MPELPEVETVRRGLIPALEGAKLVEVVQRRKDLRKPFPENFVSRLEGRTVLRLERRAKYIMCVLDDGWELLIHLGMSGKVRIFEGNPEDYQAHDHLEFVTDGPKWIRYNDPRRFGLMDLIAPMGRSQHPLLRDLGPEPLGDDFSAEVLEKAFAGKKAPLKAVLLDQRVVAGLGNIYVCEALHRAGLAPTLPAYQADKDRIERLYLAIGDILRAAIAAGGSSLRDHRQTDGELGYFQHQFDVYGREGESCKSCAKDGRTTLIERIVQSGRSTFYCPVCQG